MAVVGDTVATETLDDSLLGRVADGELVPVTAGTDVTVMTAEGVG